MSWQADGNRNAKGQFVKGNTAAMDKADAFDAKLPKILFLDIETTPIAVWVWSIGKQYVYPQNIIKDNNNNIMEIFHFMSTISISSKGNQRIHPPRAGRSIQVPSFNCLTRTSRKRMLLPSWLGVSFTQNPNIPRSWIRQRLIFLALGLAVTLTLRVSFIGIIKPEFA